MQDFASLALIRLPQKKGQVVVEEPAVQLEPSLHIVVVPDRLRAVDWLWAKHLGYPPIVVPALHRFEGIRFLGITKVAWTAPTPRILVGVLTLCCRGRMEVRRKYLTASMHEHGTVGGRRSLTSGITTVVGRTG